MKKFPKILIPMLALAALLIGACTGAPAPVDTSDGSKVESAPVEFTGVIESINGDQWVINGQTIVVDSAVLNDGPFTVGDTVKVEANVQADGTILVTRVELPSAAVVVSETAATPSASTTTPAPSASSATPDPTLVSGDNSNTNTNMNDNSNDNGDDNGYDDNGEDDSNSGGSDDSGGDN